MSSEQPAEFIYVGDAMCSWCWGFAATVEQIEQHFTIPIRLINGGLRPGPDAARLDERMRQYLTHAWQRVSMASGQPFDVDALLRRGEDWLYDTELPAIAIVTMRELNEKAVLSFYHRLQRAFYAEGIDITDPMVYEALLDGFEVDRSRFVALMAGEDMKWKAWEDFEEARGMGIAGFPALLLRTGDQLATVTRGFVPYERIEEPLVEYLTDRLGASLAEGLVCEVGGNC